MTGTGPARRLNATTTAGQKHVEDDIEGAQIIKRYYLVVDSICRDLIFLKRKKDTDVFGFPCPRPWNVFSVSLIKPKK